MLHSFFRRISTQFPRPTLVQCSRAPRIARLGSRSLRVRARAAGPRGFRKHEPSVSNTALDSSPPIQRPRVPTDSTHHQNETFKESTALVVLPPDTEGVLDSEVGEAARLIVSQPALVICRQIEMMNIFIGFEEANKYVVYNAEGETVGYIAEDSHTLTSTMARNLAGTHRAFSCHVMDPSGRVVLKIRRGFAWINSHIQIFHIDQEGSKVLVGEVKQIWSLLRRKYDLYLKRGDTMQQFGSIDEPTLSWDFSVLSEDKKLIGSINRNMRGLLKELFTDTGHYVLRMDAVDPATANLSTSALVTQGENAEARTAMANTAARALVNIEKRPMKLDERAVLMATAVSIDFDYFSKLSGAGHGGIMPMPFFFPMGSPAGAPETTPGALPESEGGVPIDGGGGVDAGESDPLANETQTDGPVDQRPWWEQDEPQEQNSGNWWDQEPAGGGDGAEDVGDWF